MSDALEWKGKRIGPYLIEGRYPGITEEEGRIYQAHHTETGEPAVVVLPAAGEKWRTPTGWSVVTTSFTDPPALVLHLARPPGEKAPSLHELTLGFVRSSGALANLHELRDARRHFTSKRPPTRRRLWKLWGLVAAGVVLTAGSTLATWQCVARGAETHPSGDWMAWPVLDEHAPFFSDTNAPDAPATVSYPMPEKPFKLQKTPPCIPVTEVEIRGGCWVQHRLDAPCPPGTAENEGKCYIPSKKKDPAPSSAQP